MGYDYIYIYIYNYRYIIDYIDMHRSHKGKNVSALKARIYTNAYL